MVIATSTAPVASDEPLSKAQERRALGVACGAHVLHDGYTDLVWLALPLWQAEFALSYGAVGLLRTLMSGTMAGLQIPSSLVAERLGTPIVLAVGTALCGFGYIVAGLSEGFAVLVVALLLAGLGASTQHGLASALVARAFPGARSLTALGTYNFAGDIGKMALPAAATALLLVMPWRPAYALLGFIGIAAGVAIFLLIPRFAPEPSESGTGATAAADAPRASAGDLKPGYFLLFTIAAIDSLTRMGFLVFVPFLLIGKGATMTMVGFALTLVFTGGAAGKLVCAFISARFGAVGTICITEGLTAAGMLALLVLPLEPSMVLLPFCGVALNGTSSATYGSVPQFATPAARNRAFSWFYSGTLGLGAIAPTLSGLVGDLVGVQTAVMLVAALVLVTLPLALMLRPAFRAVATA